MIREHFRIRRSVALLVSLTFSTASVPAHSQDDELKAIRALVEGVYALEEWHADGRVFTPPQVEGRVVYLNGSTMFVVHNRIRELAQVTAASWGDYTLSRTEFSYRYTEPATFTIAPSGITHSRRLPWEGFRSFAVVREGSSVRLTARSGSQEFLFTPTALIFSEGEGASPTTKRVYRRVVAQ